MVYSRWFMPVLVLLIACGSDGPTAPIDGGEIEPPPGTFVPRGYITPVPVGTSSTFLSVAAGDSHTCAIAANGSAWCWGAHALGLTWTQRTPWPAPVYGEESYTSIAAGVTHTCGTTVDGSIYCWAREQPFGTLLGEGSWILPRRVQTEKPVTNVVAGPSFACGLREGTAVCWGFNTWGQLGSGSSSPAADLVEVAGDLTFARLGEVLGSTVCGITRDERLYCWGRGDTGQLADAATVRCNSGSCATTPQPVAPELRFRSVSTGSHHTCALTTDGEAMCWGLNGEDNLLGTNAVVAGTDVIHRTPVPVLTEERFKEISVGADHACAVTLGNQVHCWGSNRNGQLGSGMATAWWFARPALGLFPTPMSFRSVSAGTRYTCAISVDARVFCWGRTGEHLGIGAAS